MDEGKFMLDKSHNTMRMKKKTIELLLCCVYLNTFLQLSNCVTAENVEHMPAFELQHAQTALVDPLPGLTSETIHRILRDENEPRNQLQDDVVDLQLYEHVHALQRRSIANLAATHVLKLSGHNLSDFNVSRDFLGDRGLISVLDLSENKLQYIKISGFVGLKQINLSHNFLTELPVELLADNRSIVSILNLNNNRISSGSAPLNFHLRELYLSGNQIQQLTALDLTLLTALETLDVSCNHIIYIDSSYFPQRMHNLKHLNLANNKLGAINRESFYNLLSLNSMVLTHNYISDIDYETFLALPSLQFLDLSHNQLGGESIRALQGIPDLMHLSIAYNLLVGAFMQEFVASWSLKQLDASGTGLCKIPAALAQSVRTLKVTDNWLKVINCGDLDSYPLLQYLDLSNSQIENIEDDALGRLEILEILFLDHNKLTKVPYSLPSSLVHLFLQNNLIMDIQTQAFQNLNNLQTLDLSGNQVLYLPALPLPKLLTLNLQASGLKGVNQAIVHTLPRLRDLLLEHNPIKCSDLLGIAEWASPCRINDRIELTATDIVNNNNNNSQSNVGQITTAAATSPTIINIDLKPKYERLNSFFEKFHSICSRHALQMSMSIPQPRTKQEACHQELKKVKQNSASSVLSEPQMSEMLQNDDANVVEMASEPGLATLEKRENNTSNLVSETFYEPMNLTTIRTTTMKSYFISYALAKREPTLTTLITPVNYINTPEPKLTISSTVATIDENITTVTMADKFQNNITTFAAAPIPTLTSSATDTKKYSSKIIGEKKLVTLKLPKKIKGSKFDFSVMSKKKQETEQQKHREQALNVTLMTTTEPLSLMEKDILATQQTVDKLQTITTPTKTTEHEHKHVPLHLQLKDRHLIGTPLLTHKGENILVESDELRNLPKTSTITTITTTELAIIQKQNIKETKWPQDITGLNEYDDKIATKVTKLTRGTLQINMNVKLEHDDDKKKATLKIQKILTTQSKYNAAKMLDTSDYDVSLIAETTMPPSEDTVTPLHKHSTVNMPIHYKQPHEMHTFHELQVQQLQDKPTLGINKDTHSAHWMDERKSQSNGHPVFVILLSSLFFITLLFGLLHVYRCDMAWRRHLAPPRDNQRHLTDDDQHSFLHFQHNNTILDELTTTTSHVAYRKHYNSPLHHLHVHDLTLKAETATNNYTLASSSSSSTASYSNSSSPQSHFSSGFVGEDCYVDMTPVVSTQNSLLPMELLSISSKNCRRNEYSELNTLGSRLTEARAKQATILVDSALTTEHDADGVFDLARSDALINNETHLLQKARCNYTYKATITTKRTPTTRKFDLW